MILHRVRSSVLLRGLLEKTKKMSARGGEHVAADEPTVVTKPSFDAIVVENRQSSGCLANSTGTD